MIFSLFADPRAPCDDVNNDILLDGNDNEGMEILKSVIMLKNLQLRIIGKAYPDQNICFYICKKNGVTTTDLVWVGFPERDDGSFHVKK